MTESPTPDAASETTPAPGPSATTASRAMNPVWRIVLVVAYGILCLAATGRSAYQISTKFAEAPLAYSISALSAVLYGVVAYALWKRKARLALVGTSVELAGVLIVGALGFIAPSLWPDETVWTGFGSGYGWFPLVLPAVALWLLLQERRAASAGSQASPASA